MKKKGTSEMKGMSRALNCGIGMAMIGAQEDAGNTIEAFNAAGETAWQLGEIGQNAGKSDVIFK